MLFWQMRARHESGAASSAQEFKKICSSGQETQSMKRTFTLLGLSLMLLATVAFAQRRMDDANEKAVHIVDGPRIDNITGHSAMIDWTTNSAGANHVRYRVAGSNQPWRSA